MENDSPEGGGTRQHFDGGFQSLGSRDIPGETGIEAAMSAGMSSLLQFSGNNPSTPASAGLVQHSPASPLLPYNQNSSQESTQNNMERLLFTPIKMLDFNDFDNKSERNGNIPPASLSKSSTPNPKSASKNAALAGIISPERAVTLSVDEMEASPILTEDFMERAMERELEQRLMEAGRLGEESTSDRGSRERSPVIDGAEHEDTIQSRFQVIPGRSQAGRQDNRGRSLRKQVTMPTVSSPSHIPNDNVNPSQKYPVRVGPNHRNDGLANYKITRPSHPQGMADNEQDMNTQPKGSSQTTTYLPSNRQLQFQQANQNPAGDARTQSLYAVAREDCGISSKNIQFTKGGNFQPPNSGNFQNQFGGLMFFNQNQSALSAADSYQQFHPSVKPPLNPPGYEFPENQSKFSHFQDPNQFSPVNSVPPATNLYPAVQLPGGLDTEAGLLGTDTKDMDHVWGHLQKVIQQGQALVGSVDGDRSDAISDLLAPRSQATQGQGHLDRVQGALDISPRSQGNFAWNDFMGHTDTKNLPSDLSQNPWGDNSSRYQSDPTLVAENRYLKETVEKERYRRKHCENHIHQLNSKLLEAQQQLAVVVAQDKRKDSMVEQLDKQFGQVVEGWRRKEAEMEEVVKQLRTERSEIDQAMQQQQQKLVETERELSEVSTAFHHEKDTAEKLNTQLSEQLRDVQTMGDQLTSERDRADLMTSEWEHAKEGKRLAENRAQSLQEQLHKDQDNWYNRERELLQKLDELTESNLKAVQDERTRTEEKARLVEDVEQQLKLIMTEMGRLELDLDAAVREKESLKVEMSLNEAKWENSLRQREAELRAEHEQRLSEEMAKSTSARENVERTLAERHREHMQSVMADHRAELEEQGRQLEAVKRQAEADRLAINTRCEQRVTELQTENTVLKTKKQKLEIQRTEVLSKLQLLMQSQWNEALSLLGSSSPSRADQRSYSTSHAAASQKPILTNSSNLSAVNLSLLSKHSSTANTSAVENSAATPSRENILALINGSLQSQQPSSQNSQSLLSWQNDQQNQSTSRTIGPSSLPMSAALTDLLDTSYQSDNWQRVTENPNFQGNGHSEQSGSRAPPGVQFSTPPRAHNQRVSALPHAEVPSLQPWVTPPHPHGNGSANHHPSLSHNSPSQTGHKLPSVIGQSVKEQTAEAVRQFLLQRDAGKSGGFSDFRQADYGHNSSLSELPGNNSVHQVNNHTLHSNNTATQAKQLGKNQGQGHVQRGSPTNNFPDLSILSSIHDATLTSHHEMGDYGALNNTNQAFPMRPPQQRSRPMQRETGKGKGRGVPRSQSVDDYSPVSSRKSDDFADRMRHYSGDTGSYTDNHSEPGEVHTSPRCLEFSPPTRQPRPPGGRRRRGDQDSSDNSEESVRLKEAYNETSGKPDRQARQTELQHYIQLLLEQRPTSPEVISPDVPNNSVAVTAHERQDLNESINHVDASRGDYRRATNRHAVPKPTQQPGSKNVSLNSGQLQEISRLLSLYGSQEGGEGSQSVSQSVPTTQLLNLIQRLEASREEPSDNTPNFRKPVRDSNANRRAANRQDKGRKPSKPQTAPNGVSRDVNRSTSLERPLPIRPGKRVEKGATSLAPKWK